MQMTYARPRPTFLQNLMQDAPRLTRTGLILALLAVPTGLLVLSDTRLIAGEKVWVKTLKFEISLSLYTLTLAFFARFVPATTRASRRWVWFERLVIACIAAEMTWIAGAAVLGTASHFNLATDLSAMLYRLMGVAAVTLTAASLTFGISIWRNAKTGLPPALHHSIALSLMVTFVITVITAGTMASGTGHLVGIPVTDARLPLMGWSHDVGDLRIAHFLATHTMHILPLAVWGMVRVVPKLAFAGGYLALLGYVALTVFAFVTALRGLPLI